MQRFRSARASDIDAWFEAIYPELERLIQTGQAAANTLTARYLIDHAAAEGVLVAPTLVTPEAAQVATSLRVTGPVAFKTAMARTGIEDAARRVMLDSVRGSAQRLILTGARASVAETVAKSTRIVGYRRVTSGSPCAFCAMLASRGAVYKSERSAGGDGHQYHDHDSCTTEPVYSRDSTPAPFAAEWAQAKRIARDEGIRSDVAFRRLVEGRNAPPSP